MVRAIRYIAAFAAIAIVWMASATAKSPDTIKIGLLNSMLHDTDRPHFEVLAKNFRTVMKEQTGLTGELVRVDSADDLRRQLEDGTLQLGAFHGYEFAWEQAKRPDLEPLMLAATNPDVMRPVIVVAKDCPAKNVGDLRGKTLALPAKGRDCVRMFLNRMCHGNGGNLKNFFSQVRTPDNSEDALDDLVDGSVQATAVSKASFTLFGRLKPQRAARLRVLVQSETFPPSVIAYARGKLDAATQRSFRDGMSTAHQTSRGSHLIEQIKLERFEPVPADFGRRLSDIAKVYPPPAKAPIAE